MSNISLYPCDQCSYKATWKCRLLSHVKSIHEGVKYSCDQCSYKATQKVNLARHVKSIHEGIKYSCDQCSYKATHKVDLVRLWNPLYMIKKKTCLLTILAIYVSCAFYLLSSDKWQSMFLLLLFLSRSSKVLSNPGCYQQRFNNINIRVF